MNYILKPEHDADLLDASRRPVKMPDGGNQTVFGFLASILFVTTSKDKLRIKKLGNWSETLAEKKELSLSKEDFELLVDSVEKSETSYDGHKYQAFKILDKVKEEAEKPRSAE